MTGGNSSGVNSAVRMLVTVAGCLLLNGCVGVAVNLMHNDRQGKLFQSLPDDAMVYLYGVTSCDNPAMAIHVQYSATTLAIYPGTYRYFSVKPGMHNVASSGDNEISLDTQAGRIYFIEEKIVCDGKSPVFRQRVVDQEEGKAQVRASILGLALPEN